MIELLTVGASTKKKEKKYTDGDGDRLCAGPSWR